jgi:integrin beta 3
MRDLDALVVQMGERIGPMVRSMFTRLETDLTAKLLAGTVRDALIDRNGGLVLTFGDGSTRNLGPVMGAAGPAGPQGPAGLDGAAGPAGPPGADGAAGADGAPGVDGKDGERGADVDPSALALLEGRIDALDRRTLVDAVLADGVLVIALGDGTTRELGPIIGPQGPPGVAGADGSPADVEAALAPLQARLDGIEGRTLAEALIDRQGSLVLTLADGSAMRVGEVVGRDGVNGIDGAPGKDGIDGRNGVDGQPGVDGRAGVDGKAGDPGPAGLGFDDLDVEMSEDGRALVLKFAREGVSQSFELDLPTMIYRGVYRPETDYVRGDAVTFGGSVWVANQPTQARPGETEGAWTLAVKRGRDGKDFAGPRAA